MTVIPASARNQAGTHALRPAASASASVIYYETDTGHAFYSDGSSWTQIAPGVSDAPNLHGSSHAPGGTDDVYAHYGHAGGAFIETRSRYGALNATNSTSGRVFLSYVTPPITLTVSNIVLLTSSGGSGLTLSRVGIYTVDGSGNLTLAVSSADVHASAFGSGGTAYTVALASSYQMVRGTRYALAVINVGTTPPTFFCENSAVIYSLSPRMSGAVSGQTDLPASIAVASIVNEGMFYGRAQ
jgi:hypothetical protein